MGMLRKTASIGTLGLISFRTEREKRRRVERQLLEEQLRQLRREPRYRDLDTDRSPAVTGVGQRP